MTINIPRRTLIRGLFAAASIFSASNASAQARPKDSVASYDSDSTFNYDYVPADPWPHPDMKQMFIDIGANNNLIFHSSNTDSLNHIYYYDSGIDFSGKNYSGDPKIDIIDDFVYKGKWTEAHAAAVTFIQEGGLHKIEDDAFKIRKLSSLVVALRYDGKAIDENAPSRNFPFSDDIARELQYHIYNLSGSPIIAEQAFPPALETAFTEMTSKGSTFAKKYRRLKELEIIQDNMTEEQAIEKYDLTQSLLQTISATMDHVYGTQPTPLILDNMPDSFSNLGLLTPINLDPETATEFDRLAAKYFGKNFMFVSYSNSNIDDMLTTVAHEKLHAVQDSLVRDLENGLVPDDDPRFPLAQLYALNEALYSYTDIVSCSKELAERCYQTRYEYFQQPWEANSYALENILINALAEIESTPDKKPASAPLTSRRSLFTVHP